MAVSCLELFSGIGGFAHVAEQLGWRVARAIDIQQHAGEVYRANFSHEHQVRTIESIPIDDFASVEADLWWMSPPCQPFTRRGAQRGMADVRCEAFLHVVQAIMAIKPKMVAMENVPEFCSSSAAGYLREALSKAGYMSTEWALCPTEFGIPNRRRRFYLVASRDQAPTPRIVKSQPRRLSDYLDQTTATAFVALRSEIRNYDKAIDCVDPRDELAVAACFTSAYGKSPVQSGSFLRMGDLHRRFSPREILRLLGFPSEFQLPNGLTTRQQWKLVGNSLSIPVTRHCLSALVANSPPLGSK